jgi:hypothetical protein
MKNLPQLVLLLLFVLLLTTLLAVGFGHGARLTVSGTKFELRTYYNSIAFNLGPWCLG